MCLAGDWADRLIPSNCVVLCFGWCVWDRTSTGAFFVPCWPLPLRFSCVFVSWCCGAPPFRCCCSVLLVWLSSSLCPGGLGACGVARFLLVSPLPSPPGVTGVFWSSQFSAGPSLRISGCICNGPVVIPLAWRVVAEWLLSSLRFLATKASALCGALPSTPICGWCSRAPRSGTEVFALG